MPELLKDVYNREFFEKVSSALRAAFPAFDEEAFLARVFAPGWEPLALKERMRRGTTALRASLPMPYAEALDIVVDAAEACGSGLAQLMFPDFVEMYGLDDPDRSLPALARLTKYSSGEFAVRPYLVRHPERTLSEMAQWAESGDEHVRRLASEGCRPRLPWGMALAAFKRDPSPILPILERLRADSSEYVRRSVANNLNDISKDHPRLALATARRWLGEGRPETDWIAKHACRTLLKRCDPEALELFGVGDAAGVSVRSFAADRTVVPRGGDFAASFALRVEGRVPRLLRIEYAIDYVKANGKRSRKLFKLSEREYPPGETTLSFRRSFRDLTTRRHYPGEHGAAIIVNGTELGRLAFLYDNADDDGDQTRPT